MNFQMKYLLEKNKGTMKKIGSIITAVICFVTISVAQIPERPDPPRLVNDFANVLTETERVQLEDTLVQFARATSTQIIVVTVADLEGNDPSDYAFKLGEKWGVGQKAKNNGIVVLVKPKQGNSKGQVFIATGYGLEGILPDAVVNSTVVDFEMIPRFKENDYFGGISNGVKVIMNITGGEYTAEQYQQYYAQKKSGGFIPAIIIFIFVVFAMMRRRSRFYSPGKSLPFWLAMGMLSGGHRSGGSFGNFSSGSGGFGGFGGGSFGGGGAGGSW
jgi:uncharacterized protein